MAASRSLIRPPKLKQGDRVGIVAPAGPVSADALEKGLSVIRGMGFQPVPGRYLTDKKWFLAGTDEARAEDLMDMFEDPDISAIFCARGGYGVNRILPHLKPRKIKANPKVVVGSSDLTLLLIYLMQKCSLVPFHGPMVAGSFGCRPMKVSKAQFRNLLTQAPGSDCLRATQARVIQEGRARGKLAGGCLTLLCRSLGTPYELKTDGSILLIEDVNEPAYRIDGMLWQLRQAGKFKKVKGVVFGEMVNCSFPGEKKRDLEEMIGEFFAEDSFPILFNCPVGHGNEMWTLPLGVNALLDTSRLSLELTGKGLT